MQILPRHWFAFIISTIILFGCGGGVQETNTVPSHDQWTWMGGSNAVNLASNYGLNGTPAVLGSRYGAVSWADKNGNVWIFGGWEMVSSASASFNDLWRLNIYTSEWTWVSGSNIGNQFGNYGTKGRSAVSNVPGARQQPVSWIDVDGNLWLFGGLGYDSVGHRDFLNDLWKFDGTSWIWVSGSSLVNQPGTYGASRVTDVSNVPGARVSATSWTDNNGNLWLFGGNGIDSNAFGLLNDLWKFDGVNWTWVSGGNTVYQPGIYGSKEVPAAANVPGSRDGAVSWIDLSGNLWLFGGRGYDANGSVGFLNDLWKFDGANWTWMSGSKTVNQLSTYGTKGDADRLNVPGSRHSAVSWIDLSGNLWLFGGYTFHPIYSGGGAWLNDLWKFDVAKSEWTWMSGSDAVCNLGHYGTLRVPSADDVPGASYGGVSWVDASGGLWFFGGLGNVPLPDGTGTSGLLNALWRYQP